MRSCTRCCARMIGWEAGNVSVERACRSSPHLHEEGGGDVSVDLVLPLMSPHSGHSSDQQRVVPKTGERPAEPPLQLPSAIRLGRDTRDKSAKSQRRQTENFHRGGEFWDRPSTRRRRTHSASSVLRPTSEYQQRRRSPRSGRGQPGDPRVQPCGKSKDPDDRSNPDVHGSSHCGEP